MRLKLKLRLKVTLTLQNVKPIVVSDNGLVSVTIQKELFKFTSGTDFRESVLFDRLLNKPTTLTAFFQDL